MKECSKAAIRRAGDPVFVTQYFVGNGLDIGGAPDPLSFYRLYFPRMGDVRIWDMPQGDAQFLKGIESESLDFVHSSHCLEHLVDPFEGLNTWFRAIKPGGYLIVTVPDEDLYEQGLFPSTFNADHKWTFTIGKRKSWSPKSINVTTLLDTLGEAADIRRLTVLESGYRFDLPRIDQTMITGTECAIEFVVRKRTQDEVKAGGPPVRTGSMRQEEFEYITGIDLDAK